MPQELQVLRCYSCRFFQVHIVKKSRKWECKMCGEKQSLKNVYGKGSGKDCRLHVQKLNRLASLQQENQINAYGSNEDALEEDDVHGTYLHNSAPSVSSSSKWSVFLDKPDDEEGNIDTFNESHEQYAGHSVANLRSEADILTTFRNEYYQTEYGHENETINVNRDCFNDAADPGSIYRSIQEDSLPKSSENKWLKYMDKARNIPSSNSNKQLSDNNVYPEQEKKTVCDESIVYKMSSNWDNVYPGAVTETSAQLTDVSVPVSAMKATERQTFPGKLNTLNVNVPARAHSAFDRDYNEDELNSILDI